MHSHKSDHVSSYCPDAAQSSTAVVLLIDCERCCCPGRGQCSKELRKEGIASDRTEKTDEALLFVRKARFGTFWTIQSGFLNS